MATTPMRARGWYNNYLQQMREQAMRGRRRIHYPSGEIFWEPNMPVKDWGPYVENHYDTKGNLLGRYQYTQADFDAEARLKQLREDAERQVNNMRLSREEIAVMRTRVEQLMGDTNTQELGKLRARVSQLEATLTVARQNERTQRVLAEKMSARVIEYEGESTGLKQQVANLQRELARLQPDPNDPRDWSGDPIWESTGPVLGDGVGRWVQPVKPEEQAPNPVGEDLEPMPWKWEWANRLDDFVHRPLVQAATVVVGSGAAFAVSQLVHLHLVW